jgi:hypothetical protein
MKLISTPQKRRNGANELKQTMGLVLILADEHGAIDRFIDICNHPVLPAPDLVAKSPEPAESATSNRALNSHPSSGAFPGRDRPRVLDHEAPFSNRHYEG